jgi:uncharacterized membrane protein YhhN
LICEDEPMEPWIAVMVTTVAVGAMLLGYAREARRVIWVAKPMASTGFIAAALYWGAAGSTYGRAVLVALVLSWAGDVLLIPRSRGPFLAGILAFLGGHLAFGGAFALRGVSAPAFGGAVVGLVVVGVPLGRWLLPQVSPSLKGAVGAYVVVLSAMVALAIGTFGARGDARIAAGAVCFYLSDISVALDRFVAPGFRNKVWGTPLYYGAQLLFAATTAGG